MVYGNVDALEDAVVVRIVIHYGFSGLPGNERADLLAKTGAPTSRYPCSLPTGSTPTTAKIRNTRCSLWRRNLSHISLFCQISSVFSDELALSRFVRCELSRLRCHDLSLLFSSYLCRIKRKKNSLCSACGHPLQDLTHLLLDCPASEPHRRAIFGTTSSIFDLW